MFSVRPRTKATHCARWFGYGIDCKDTCISGSWKESDVGHFDTESKIAEKQVLVPTRSPENITIKYPRCIRRAETKATYWRRHNCLSVCPSAWNISFPRELTFVIFYTEKFYYSSVEKFEIGLMSEKNIRHFTCDLWFFYWEKRR